MAIELIVLVVIFAIPIAVLCVVLKGMYFLLNTGVREVIKATTFTQKKSVNFSLDDQKFLR